MNRFRRSILLCAWVCAVSALPTHVQAANGFDANGHITDAVQVAQTLARLRAMRQSITARSSNFTARGTAFAALSVNALSLPSIESLADRESAGTAGSDIRKKIFDDYAALSPVDIGGSAPPPGSESAISRGGETAPGVASQGLVGGLSGLPSETDLVVGLADFLGERAKEELVQSFLLDLCAAVHRQHDVVSLMPASIAVLDQIDKTGYRSVVPALTASFHSDLEDLPGRIGALETGDPGAELQIALRVCTDARKGLSPAVALQDLLGPVTVKIEEPEVRFALLLGGSLARDYSAHCHDARHFWDRDQIADYVAAVVIQIQDQYDGDFSKIIANLAQHLEAVSGSLETLDALQQRLASASRGDLQLRDIIESMQSMIDLTLRLCPETGSCTETMRGLRAELVVAHDVECAIASHEWGDVVAAAIPLLPESMRAKNTPGIRYLVFAGNLASAGDADAVRAALNSVAEPVGAFRVKRDRLDGVGSRTNVTINSYVGPAVGVEWRREGGDVRRGTASYPLTAQVGVELCRSTGCESISSFSFLLSVLDLGNLLAYRASGKEDLGGSPQLGFRQVTAPGAFLVFGISRTHPISLGVGYQIAPELRRDLTTSHEVDVQRFSTFLALDLPIIRF